MGRTGERSTVRILRMSGVGGTSTSSLYDSLGRRESKTISSTSTNFLYGGLNLEQELNGTTPTVNYLTGAGVDETLSRMDSSGTESYLTDNLGSTLALTNSAGAISTSYSYEPYGNTTATGTTNTNALQYTGRENDGDGLYYYRARYYSPTYGRFINEDSSYDTASYDELNLYSYAASDPVNWIDPFGLFKLKKGGKHPPVTPSPLITALLDCIEDKTGLQLQVTSTSEAIPQHPPGTPHRLGLAVDVRYSPGTAGEILCAAEECGAGFALNEALHPSAHSTGPHLHLQIPRGKRGGRGDLPKSGCGCGQ